MRLARASSALVSIAAPLVLVRGLFTTTRIFYVRDLSFFFWSRHLWLRHTVFAGQWPAWDPFVAGGQSAIADALNQLAMPVTLAVRLLPSDVVSFNLWVALPLPVAAAGMFLFLLRRFAPEARPTDGDTAQAISPAWAAAFGAVVFALSGPIVSMLNSPNLAWSVALIPWVMAAADVRGTLLAVAFGLQALCGEPVTWAATGVIVVVQAVVKRRPRPIAGLAVGVLLASVQLVPTLTASVRAHRAALATPDFWSLHPLSLWEGVAPHLFGNYYEAFLADLPWMAALNFGRDPFFYSLYVGPLVLLLACAGAARLRRNWLWIAVALIFATCAMGGYTPVYPLARRIVPGLMYFRFPVKYIVFTVFAVAVLAAEGWRAMPSEQARYRLATEWVPGLAGGGVVAITVALIARPAVLQTWSQALAIATRLKNPAAGAAVFARIAPPLALRAGAMLLAGALLAALSRRRPYAWWLLAGIACLDLAATGAGLNPTMDVTRLSPPAWFTAAAGPQRVYIGGRVRGYMNTDDPDAAPTWHIPAESAAVAGRMELNAELPMAPSGWGVREALSYDLPYLWPAEYDAAVQRFEMGSAGERDAFLRRAGVRWCVVRASQPRAWRAITDVSDWDMRVYECHADASRVAMLPSVPGADALFDEAPPEPGLTGEARIVEDGSTQVAVEASADRASFLVLRDSYDPSWHATVDGAPVPIARAYGLYRAVALPAGRHLIRFSYRPREFLVGLSLTVAGMALIGLAGSGFFRFAGPRGRRRSNQGTATHPCAGFTLIELMVVLAIIAIVMAIAFTEYRNLKARGNEASALSSMRSIAAAQWQFATTCGKMKYATTLPALGQPVPATGASFLSPDLTEAETIEKSGYVIRMAGKPLIEAPPACNGAPVANGYAAAADPVKPGVNGTVYYGVNADRILYMDAEKSFKEDLPEWGAAPHGSEVK